MIDGQITKAEKLWIEIENLKELNIEIVKLINEIRLTNDVVENKKIRPSGEDSLKYNNSLEKLLSDGSQIIHDELKVIRENMETLSEILI